jgi:hypothetical protein
LGLFYLEGDLKWAPNPGQWFETVPVPEGFVTDLASVPLLWSKYPPQGRYAYAAIVHDYLDWTPQIKKEEADDILKAAMQDAKVDPILRCPTGRQSGSDWSSHAACLSYHPAVVV